MAVENRQMDPGTWINNMIGTSDAYNPTVDGADPNSLAVKIGSAYRASPYWTGQGQFFGDPTAFAQNYTGTSDPLSAFKKLQGMGNLPGISTNFGVLNPTTGMLDQQNTKDDGLGEWLKPMGIFAGLAGGAGLINGAFGGAATGGTGAFDMGGMGANFGNYVSPAVGATGAGMDPTELLNSFDSSGMPSYTSPDLNTTNFPDLNPDTANAYDSMMREAGINPSSPGALDAVKNWAINNPGSVAKVLGSLGGAALSFFGGQKQAGALQSLAQQNLAYGAPSRARFEASMTPGFDPMSIPGYAGALDSTSKNVLARLSATGGNPFGNPGGLIDANKQIVAGTALPAIQNYQNENLNAGYGPGFGASNSAATGAINADAGSLTGAAGALGQLTAPDNSLAGIIAQLKAQGINIGSGGLNLANGGGL